VIALVGAGLALMVSGPAPPVPALDERRVECHEDPECALRLAAEQLARGEPRAAITLLKPLLAAGDADGRLGRALASAYLAEGNDAWALRTLLARLELDPGDLETRTWAAWLLASGGDVKGAGALLEAGEPLPVDGPLARRAALLRAALLDLGGDPTAARIGLKVAERLPGSLLPEDRPLVRHLRRSLRGDARDPLSMRLLLSAGFTSNAARSSPADPAAETAGPSATAPLAALDLLVRAEPWMSDVARPYGELRVRLFGPLAPATLDHAWGAFAGRVGIEFGGAGPRLRLSYDGELLALHGGDAYREPGPRWFTEAHRADVEFVPVPAVQLFAGAGRRIYRERPRTRTEVDGGIALQPPLPRGWALALLVAGRWHDARSEAWDGGGATLLGRLVAPLPGGGFLRVKLLAGVDGWPASAAAYHADGPRVDLLGRAQVGPWSPPLRRGLRLGFHYELAARYSTVALQSYTDHRLLGELRWELGWDPTLGPRWSTPESRWPLPWGLAGAEGGGLDRVHDLLRQEDSARRGSSCVD
jgi:hypothetical protein